MKYFLDSVTSWAYWRYVLFSRSGAESVFAIFGAIYLVIEALDFFSIYKRDEYGSYGILIFLSLSILLSIIVRRPIQSISIPFPQGDFTIEVCIGDLFEMNSAVMVSTNSEFESDVAGGRISPNSLQGQFTARYFTGNQDQLIEKIADELKKLEGTPPYPMGTTIPIYTHGKTFYFSVMADLNEQGNASTSVTNVKTTLRGLWSYVHESGELQALAVPIIGTERGRLQLPRKKVIELIADSFVNASREHKLSDQLTIVVHPDDARRFELNLYDVRDHLKQSLVF